MREAVSTELGRPCRTAPVCRVLGIPRSTLYARRKRAVGRRPSVRRGPKTTYTDAELTDRIRRVLAASPFTGEGHRKAWARLRFEGIRTSRRRVLRLMREANLLAPVRAQRALGPRVHDGTIVTERPDLMWGADLTATVTVEDGQVAVFAAIDHCTAECVGIHAAKSATRFEALDPIRQGVRQRRGSYGQGAARDLRLRHDHGSQYTSDAFQEELRFLGIESSPAFVRQPEGNGCIERFFRTLKEQLLWVRTFRNVEELRKALHEWVRLYNEEWLIERHGFKSPAQMRRELLDKETAA